MVLGARLIDRVGRGSAGRRVALPPTRAGDVRGAAFACASRSTRSERSSGRCSRSGDAAVGERFPRGVLGRDHPGFLSVALLIVGVREPKRPGDAGGAIRSGART